MSDPLAEVPEKQLAEWYRRLADLIGQEQIDGRKPLASIFLKHWLDNRDPASTLQFQPPAYLRQSPHVIAAQQYHRDVFLSRRKARFTGGRSGWAGVLPRLQGRPGFTRWTPDRPIGMHYHSLVEVGSNPLAIWKIKKYGTPAEKDILTSLRGFQLKSRVTVSRARTQDSKMGIKFDSWKCMVFDRYDFDYSEYFTVPNPDYQSNHPDAVRPQDEFIKVEHKNAKRLEQANLAAPYKVESHEWNVTDKRITAPGIINPSQRL